MIDYDKPLLGKDGNPLKIVQAAKHHCIRCIKKARALRSIGYEVHGMGDMLSYGTGEHDTYHTWKSKEQFKNSIRMFVNSGVQIVEWNNEPDEPVTWIREVLKDMNKEDDVKIVTDCHDLDSIRKEIIPIPERGMFNNTDGLIYVSEPIQKMTNT